MLFWYCSGSIGTAMVQMIEQWLKWWSSALLVLQWLYWYCNDSNDRAVAQMQAPAVDLCLTIWPSCLARLGYLKRDETGSNLSRCLKRDVTSSISRDLMVMTVSNHLTGRFLILNGHRQKIMNSDEIKRDKNGQNMFDRRCLLKRYDGSLICRAKLN